MAAITISTRLTTMQSAALGDSILVTQSGSIFRSGTSTALGIIAAGNNHVVIDGDILLAPTTGNGIQFNSGGNNVTIGATGSISAGGAAIFFTGSSMFSNSGSLYGGSAGVAFGGGSSSIFNAGSIVGGQIGMAFQNNTTNCAVVNTGLILGDSAAGAGLNSFGGSNFNIQNFGTIDGAFGIGLQIGTAGTSNSITNYGTVIGRSSYGILTTEANDHVTNSGVLYGNQFAARLGNGADFFDGRQGFQAGAVQGEAGDDSLYGGVAVDDLQGGAGNDNILGGAGADLLDGGADFDLVRYDFATTAVTVRLDNPSLNTGEAAGDTLLNFEGIVGSGFADILVGDGNANRLVGQGGNDAIAGGDGVDAIFGSDGADNLFGQGGSDTITGGVGGDMITGGLGGDIFVLGLGDQGDLIMSFNEGGLRDGFDLRPFFDSTGFTGTDPRGAGIMQVLQNGADTDVFLYGAFAFRIQNVVAAAVDDTYFLFQ